MQGQWGASSWGAGSWAACGSWAGPLSWAILVRETREKIGRGMWVCWEQDSKTLSSKKLGGPRKSFSASEQDLKQWGEALPNAKYLIHMYICNFLRVPLPLAGSPWQDLHFASADQWCHHCWLIKCWLTSYWFTSCWHLLVSSQLGVHCWLFVLVDVLGASLLPPIFSF